MFYAVVLSGMDSVYVFGENDAHALHEAQRIAEETDKTLRLVFVSAHNDPANGPSGMREVYRLCDDCGGRGQHRAGAGEHFQTSICGTCHGEGAISNVR